MKKLILFILMTAIMTGCRSCVANYEQRRAGVQKICKGCTYVRSEQMDIAVDTTKQPNVVYRVVFCSGGYYYNAWDVDHLVRIN